MEKIKVGDQVDADISFAEDGSFMIQAIVLEINGDTVVVRELGGYEEYHLEKSLVKKA